MSQAGNSQAAIASYAGSAIAPAFSVPLFLGNESAETEEEGDGRKFRLNSRAPAVEINIFPSNLGPLTQFFFHEEETGEEEIEHDESARNTRIIFTRILYSSDRDNGRESYYSG